VFQQGTNMNIQKFVILRPQQGFTHERNEVNMLINLDHVISIKPINMTVDGEVESGYWLRLINGKKYKALHIPKGLAHMMES